MGRRHHSQSELSGDCPQAHTFPRAEAETAASSSARSVEMPLVQESWCHSNSGAAEGPTNPLGGLQRGCEEQEGMEKTFLQPLSSAASMSRCQGV